MNPIFLSFWLLISCLVGGMIGQKRGCTMFGVLLGFLLGPLGWLITAINDRRPVCPECKGRYTAGARRCQNCGAEFTPAPAKMDASVKQAPAAANWQQTVAAGDEVAQWAKQKPPEMPVKAVPNVDIHFECPKCSQRMSGNEVLQLHDVDCPGCGVTFKPVPLAA